MAFFHIFDAVDVLSTYNQTIMTENKNRGGRSILVPLLIALNVVVYAMWNFGDEQFMLDNFTASWDGLLSGRFWILLSAVFSHNLLIHILINMFVLNSFGSIMEEALGRTRFLWFYLVAGVVSSVVHALVSAFLMGTPEMRAVGASGAIAGLVLVFSLTFPREKILIFGIIPVPAILGALAFIGLDLWGLYAQAGGGGLPIGHGAHLGGAFTGIVYYLFYVRGRQIR